MRTETDQLGDMREGAFAIEPAGFLRRGGIIGGLR